MRPASTSSTFLPSCPRRCLPACDHGGLRRGDDRALPDGRDARDPAGGEEQLLVRGLVLVAMAVCGTVYSGIDASRRRGDPGMSRAIELALTYQRHSDLLKKVRLARSELRSAREQIDRHRSEPLDQIPVLDEKARSALLAGCDSAARSALTRRVTAAASAGDPDRFLLRASAGSCRALQRGQGAAAHQRGSRGAHRRPGRPRPGPGAGGGQRNVDASPGERARRGDGRGTDRRSARRRFAGSYWAGRRGRGRSGQARE